MLNFLKRWWLPALIVSLPFEALPTVNVPIGTHSVTLRFSMVIAALGILLFGAPILKKLRISLTSPYFWLFLYELVMLASLITSIDKSKSIIVIVATTLCVAGGVIVAHLVRGHELVAIEVLLLGVTCLICLFGLYQFLGDSFGLPTWATGLHPNYVKAVFGFPRIQSTLQEPLFFANYLLLPTLLTASLLYARIRAGRWHFAQLFLFSLTLALTLSRGGIVGGLIALVAIAILLLPRTTPAAAAKVIGLVALGGLCAVGLIYSVTAISSPSHNGGQAVRRYVQQSTHLEATTTSADSDRVTDKRLAKQAFEAKPILGNGIGSFGAYAQRHLPAKYPAGANLPTVNNEYYEVLAETGLAGAIALVGFVLTLSVRIYGSWKRLTDPLQRAWLVALTATGLAYGAQYYAFSTLYISYIWVTIGLLLAITSRQFGRKPAASDA
jgi:O-antigen ligase